MFDLIFLKIISDGGDFLRIINVALFLFFSGETSTVRLVQTEYYRFISFTFPWSLKHTRRKELSFWYNKNYYGAFNCEKSEQPLVHHIIPIHRNEVVNILICNASRWSCTVISPCLFTKQMSTCVVYRSLGGTKVFTRQRR